MPTNPHRWPKAGAFGLVWRPRAVPRTHGTRAATGLRPAGHYEPPARSSLTTGIAGESAARRRDKNAASGAPRGERPDRKGRKPRPPAWLVYKVRLPALRSPSLSGEERKRAHP